MAQGWGQTLREPQAWVSMAWGRLSTGVRDATCQLRVQALQGSLCRGVLFGLQQDTDMIGLLMFSKIYF